LSLQNGQICNVKTIGPMGIVFNNVLIRVGAKAIMEMHIDTDEGNAAGLTSSAYGILL
jgi:putative phosphotransacetylase